MSKRPITFKLCCALLVALRENYANKEYQMKVMQEGKLIAQYLIHAETVLKIIQQITLNCQWLEQLEKPIQNYFFDKK